MMADYEQNHYDKELLKQAAVNLGTLDVPVTDLEQVRVLINRYCEEQPDAPKLSPDWCFIDCELKPNLYQNLINFDKCSVASGHRPPVPAQLNHTRTSAPNVHSQPSTM